MVRAPVLPSPVPRRRWLSSLNVLPLSDLHLPANPTTTELLLTNREYLDFMDYVVLVGDQVSCYGTDREYAEVGRFVERLARPYAVVNGNHEFYFRVADEESGQYAQLWEPQEADLQQRQLDKFQRFFGLSSLWHCDSNSLGYFIYLSLNDVGNPKPESLDAPQQAFLRDQLGNADGRPIFIFCHAPLILGKRLDMEYYNAQRTASIEPEGDLKEALESYSGSIFWISGHIHLHPEHYLFPVYRIAGHIWQVHCPDSWGFSRWERSHLVPQRHQQLFSRHLEIRNDSVTFVTHDHQRRIEMNRQIIRL